MSAIRISLAVGFGLLVLVWAVIARESWRARNNRQTTTVATLAMALWSFNTLFSLIPASIHAAPPGWLIGCYILTDHVVLALAAFFRHDSYARALDDRRPTRRWLAVNYGSAVLIGILTPVFPALLPGRDFPAQLALYKTIAYGYVLAMFCLALRDLRRGAQRGWWRPGGGGSVIRRADIALVGVGMLALGGSVVLMVRDPMDTGDLFLLVLLLVGLATAGPFLARIPGAVLHGVLVWTALLGAAATLQRGAATLTRVLPEPSLRPMVEIVLLVALVLVLGPGRSALGAAVDWLLFRQSRRRAAQLQGIVHAISPEIGMTAVCEEALAGFVGILGLRGAALIFRDGQAVVHGDLEIGPVLRIWPRDTALDALAAETFDDLPPRLRRELAGTDVAGLLPVVGPRRRWGHLMVSMPALSAPYSDEELRAAVGFANALALVLDAAELVARAATVERSLAHAEKLAVLGEFAARIVHDVRNPVTAARSFAQRLARAPAGGTDAEAATLILSELERVERYMAALLRFARRDEIRPEAVDLGALAQSTVKACRPRLEADGISVTVEAMDLVTVRADPEKLRQVLANIVENAADALQSSPERRLVVSVAKANGTATLGVTDSGPGVTESEIDRLFEPFFTTKTHGTGLGLAIAQRTVEAHGGRIVAARAPSGGMSFRVELPLAGLADGRA